MPIQPSPSYHRYDITDYYQVNPDYGTLDDFKRLISEAHQRGMPFVIDFVANHTSLQHPWFQQSQTQPPLPAIGTSGQTPIRVNCSPGDRMYGITAPMATITVSSGKGCAEYNYKTNKVADEMDKVARFWLSDMGSDGLRVDGARYLVEDDKVLADSDGNHAWFKHLRTVYKAINPNLMTVGEVWTDNEAVSKYAQGDEFDLLFDFDLASALVKSAQNENADSAHLSPGHFLEMVACRP